LTRVVNPTLFSKGGLMRKDILQSSGVGKAPSPPPEIDSAPKTYALREQIFSGLKMAAIIGVIFLLLWLFDKM